ncbi:hypothetical protein [Sphingobium cloacae]|uniref:DUF2336 domain-containing protein n=1 Tax=Sphingobium cloacae TaxID=120107 RepID=A0A1E1F107_9SPHN|nr:hypothetical protein [Sphingobium cloacae]BAV64184.1 hypothetical protein SCLO_1011440 [Sphingobium cloacae]
MSAYPTLAGSILADCWPMTRVMAGLSAVPIGHAIDLAFLFPLDGRERNDALIAETRRHLGGCLTAIEIAFRTALQDEAAIAEALDAWPDPLCWPTVRAQPTMLGPPLLAHMQMRAGISLLLRQAGCPDSESVVAEEADSALPADDPTIGDALSALALAEGRWLMAGGEDQPLRPDVPAEYFAELVWTAAACLAAVVQRASGTDDAVMAAFERAGEALLRRHDEAANPLSIAEVVVRQLGERADAPELLASVLTQRRFLLFTALAARRLRMESAQVADILLFAPLEQVAALSRALGGSDSDHVHLLLALRPVRPSLSDAVIVVQAEHYQSLPALQADATVSALRTPAAFRAKLDHLRRVTAG